MEYIWLRIFEEGWGGGGVKVFFKRSSVVVEINFREWLRFSSSA